MNTSRIELWSRVSPERYSSSQTLERVHIVTCLSLVWLLVPVCLTWPFNACLKRSKTKLNGYSIVVFYNSSTVSFFKVEYYWLTGWLVGELSEWVVLKEWVKMSLDGEEWEWGSDRCVKINKGLRDRWVKIWVSVRWLKYMNGLVTNELKWVNDRWTE